VSAAAPRSTSCGLSQNVGAQSNTVVSPGAAALRAELAKRRSRRSVSEAWRERGRLLQLTSPRAIFLPLAKEMSTFPVVCTACTQNYGPCLTQCQARINQIDACDVCTGSLCVSGMLTAACANVQTLSTLNLNATTLTGTPSIPCVALGTPAYSSTPEAAVLNGQQLQASVFSQGGAVPLTLANGSTLLMGVLPTSAVFVLDRRCNPGTFFFFFNSGSTASTIALSAPGTINSSSAGIASTFSVGANTFGVIVNVGPSQWVTQ